MNQFVHVPILNKLLPLLPVLLMALRATVSAETVEWIGGPADPQWGRAENWDVSRVPGAQDDVIIARNQAAVLGEGAGEIRSLKVGGSTGNGALNVHTGAFLHAGGVAVGQPSSAKGALSYFSQSDGEIRVSGDFVLGSEGSAAQAFFTAGRLMIEGALLLAPSGAQSSNFALKGGGGEISAGSVSIGSAGALVFDFLDGASLKTIAVAEGIELSDKSTLTVCNAAQARPGETYTLLSGKKLSGAFSQINLEGFDPSVRAVIEHDAEHGKVLLKTVRAGE